MIDARSQYEIDQKIEDKRRKKLEEKVKKILLSKGIKLATSACGCCEGVTFDLEVDGKLIANNEIHFNFSNFGEIDENS